MKIGHISVSTDPRRVYKGSNWRSWCPLFINDCFTFLFYIRSWEIQINTNFAQIRQKRQYNLKRRSSPKSIGFLRKHIQITMQNFRAIGATSFELSRDKKLTTWSTIWSTLKKKSSAENVCMCVCLSVCVCVRKLSVFISRDNSKEVAPIALKFCMVICIYFFNNPIDFGDDLPKIVVFRLYCRFCLIWAKFVYCEFLEFQCIKKILNNH